VKRLLVCALMITVGCGPADPCDPFPDETCLSLEVRGPGLTVDQIGVRALSGLVLSDGRSPAVPAASYDLPVRLPILPGGQFAGTVELEVRGFLIGVVLGADTLRTTVAAGQHLAIIAELGGANASDLAGIDLAGRPDLAQPAGVDLAGRDLTAPAGADLASPGGFVSETSSVTDVEFMSVWGTSSSDVYVISLLGDIFHSTGNGQWQLQRGRVANQAFKTIWGSAADDIWAGGGLFPCGGTTGGAPTCEAKLLHSTGNGSWSTITPPGSDANFGVNITAIGGTSKTNLYFAISGTMSISGVLHSTNGGGNFTLEPFNGQAVPDSIFAASATDLYAVRGVSDVLHSTGSGTWPKQADLMELADSIFGTSATNLYAAASDFDTTIAAIYHSPGNGTWSREATTFNIGFANSMTAANAGDLYAAYNCGLLHSTGNGTWTQVPLPKSGCVINAAWAAPDGAVFIVGEKGLILHKP
jgi:hypothetical protein